MLIIKSLGQIFLQFHSVRTFEPGTRNPEPMSLGTTINIKREGRKKMKKVKTVVILLVVISLPVLSSHALAAKYTFIPRLNVESYYTDNLFLEPNDEEDDIVTTVVPGFIAGVSGRTAGIDVNIAPGYTFYKNNTDRNYWRFDGGLNGFLDITKYTTLTVTNRYYLTRDPDPENQIDDVRAGEPGVSLDPTVRQGRAKYWRNNFGARADHQFGQDKSIFAEYRNRILRNDNNVFYEDSNVNTGLAGLTYFFDPKWGTQFEGTYSKRTFDQTNDYAGIPSSDSDVWGGRVRLIRRFSRSTNGFLEYTYGNVKYTSRNIFSVVPGGGQPTLVVNEDYQVHDGRVGVDYEIAQDITLSANFGWAFKVNDVTDNQNGGVGELVLRKDLDRGGFRVEAEGGYTLGTFDTTAQNYGVIRFYRVGATGDYQLFKRIYGDIYGAYRRNKYIDTIPERDEDRYTAGAGITWRPVRWGSIRLGYSYRQNKSDVDIFEYTENRIFLNLSLSTELPYRALF
jgi:hypothetical protein